jgi:hypothetical protein
MQSPGSRDYGHYLKLLLGGAIGLTVASAMMYFVFGPKGFNIEMDPHEDLVVAGLFGWTSGPALKAVEEYLASVKKYPNPPAPNITQFGRGG